MNRKPSYLKAVVIVHGKSEKHLCDYIKSNLKLKIDIYGDKHGGKSIQITSLNRFLNNMKFKSLNNFIKNYENDFPNNMKKLPKDFKIFIIMDTDDCTEAQKEAYINKSMFNQHWAKDYIYPIYNIKNLEDVMRKSGIDIEKKSDYIKIFPTDKNYLHNDSKQINEFMNNILKNSDITNLQEFIKFCVDIAYENCYFSR